MACRSDIRSMTEHGMTGMRLRLSEGIGDMTMTMGSLVRSKSREENAAGNVAENARVEIRNQTGTGGKILYIVRVPLA